MLILIMAGAVVGTRNKKGYALALCRACVNEPWRRAVAACSKTAEDVATQNGEAAAYAEAVKRVRRRHTMDVYLCVSVCARARACVCVWRGEGVSVFEGNDKLLDLREAGITDANDQRRAHLQRWPSGYESAMAALC